MAVPDLLAPSGDAYVLRVRGDSMIEEHIADGDFVLIRPQTTARNGDIVVAQVEDNARHPQALLPREGPRPPAARQTRTTSRSSTTRSCDPGKLIGVIRKLD
jgi:repressor LexA